MDQLPGPANLKIMLQDSDNKTTVLDTHFEVIAKKFPVQHLTVDESKDALDQQTLERHNRERAQIENMFAQSRHRRLWTKNFIQPLQGRLSTPFGVKRFINEQPRNPHSGIDIAAPAGTPVKATAAGVVCLTAEHFFAGQSVYIDHGCDTFSMYFHLDTIAVQDGQSVAGGDIIGRVGATGRATGPHLHWGIRMYGTPIDPFSLLALFKK
jgi:murein DD-endopeptidase MepM/ murein hydrolase activator NlpD